MWESDSYFMNLTKEAKEIIRTLEENQFYAECPCCGEPILLKDAGLFYLDDFSPEAEKLFQQKLKECKIRENELREERKAISRRSETATETINIGFILERIAPIMRDFRFDRNDCRSLFDPIDYIIFEGLSKKNSVSKILFTEIKTGKARLNLHQKEIRKLVECKQVTWDTYKKG
jgi:predicted Holliday junction resolvase-like endonuclease